VLIGSLGITDGEKILNRSYLINSAGDIVARYDKMHLFDIQLSDDVWFRESDTFAAGEQAVLATSMGTLAGMSICYDVRFPQLYSTYAQAGAKMLFVPAAFTRPTGKAHWHSLLRARAIENGAWVIAPGQHGTTEGGCFGHSLIIDPWGTIQAECGDGEDIGLAEIDLSLVDSTRAKIPSLMHSRAIKLAP
jgi:predicted amidohydrolase